LDEYFVLTDSIDRIVGGICYRKVDSNSVLIDGSIVISALSNRGLGSAMLEDFCSRMASQGIDSVKAHFFLKNFFLKRGFTIDKRHGTLVRFLNTPVAQFIKGSYCII
jgi:N-acetylglutamate synthase-like GNAT family acetyltransferase